LEEKISLSQLKDKEGSLKETAGKGEGVLLSENFFIGIFKRGGEEM